MFEGFLIWGLGQPQSTVPSSIIPAEQQRGDEGVERRKKTRGDGMISYLSSPSPTCPITSDYFSLHLSNLQLARSFHLLLSSSHCLSIYLTFLSHFPFSCPLHPECLPVAPGVALSVRLSVCLSDCLTSAPTVVPFVSADK